MCNLFYSKNIFLLAVFCTVDIVTSTTVTNCLPGEYFDNVSCNLCPIGKFQALPAQTSCRTCPINHTTAFLGGAIYTDCVCKAMSYKDSYGFCAPCPEGSESLVGQNMCTCPDINNTDITTGPLDCTSVLKCSGLQCCLLFPCLEKVKCWGDGPTGYNSNNIIGDDASDLGSNLPFLPFDNVKAVFCYPLTTCLKFNDAGVISLRCFGYNSAGHLLSGNRNHYGFSQNQYEYPVEDSPTITKDTFNEYALLDYVFSRDTACALLTQTVHVIATGDRIFRKNVIKCFAGSRAAHVFGIESEDVFNDYKKPEEATAVKFGDSYYPIEIISIGASYACARMQTGDVKCWGKNFYGILGYGDFDDRGSYENQMGNYLPFVDFGTNYVISMTSQAMWKCGLLDNARVKCWGYNGQYQLGLGHTQNLFSPSEFISLDSTLLVKQMAIMDGSTSGTGVLLSDGNVKVWGNGKSPHLPSLSVGEEIVNLQGIDSGFCSLTLDGFVKCWGAANPQKAQGDMYDNLAGEAVAANLGHTPACFRTNFDLMVCPQNCKEGEGWNSLELQCVPCVPGTYSDVFDTSQCNLCPPNTYSTTQAANISSACIACVAFSNSSAGSSREADCICIPRYGKIGKA